MIGTRPAGGHALLLLALLAAACGRAAPPVKADGRPGPDAVAARVDGDPIGLGELERAVAARRAEVFDHFFATYQVEHGPGFWTSTHGGERPIDMVRTRALDALVRIKVAQGLMRRHGIVPGDPATTAYASSGYGPRTLTAEQAFRHRFANDELALKERLGQGPLRPDEAELRQTYEAVKENRYRRGATRAGRIVSDAAGYQPFDEVRPRLVAELVDRKYRALLEGMVAKARVEIVPGVYDAVAID